MSTSWPYNTYLNNQTFGILQKEPGKGSGILRPRKQRITFAPQNWSISYVFPVIPLSQI